MELRQLFNQAKRLSTQQLLLIIMAIGFLGALYPAQRVLAAGYRNGCFELAPSGGWTRTIYWVNGQRWGPTRREGPWAAGTRVWVQETNDQSKPTCSSSGTEAYQDGQLWWGTFRKYYGSVERGDTSGDPSYGRKRFARDTWWSGWTRPAIGGLVVGGYWLLSTASGGPGNESVFVALDEEIWPEDPPATPTPTTPPPPTATFSPRTLAIQVRACDAGGGFVPSGDVSITAWSASWNQSAQSSNVAWSVPGQYTQASYSVTLNPRWAMINGSSSGTVNVPATVQLVAWSDSCNPTTVGTPTPTSPPPPIGCQRTHDQWLDSMPLFTPRNVLNRTNQPVNLPTAPGNNVPYLRPDQTSFDFFNDRAFPFDGDDDWEGGSIVAYHKNELGNAIELYSVTAGGGYRSRSGLLENIYTTAHGTWGGIMEIQGSGLNGPTTRLGTWPVYQVQRTYNPMPVNGVGLRVRFNGPLPVGLYRIRVTTRGVGQGNGWTMKDWDDGANDLNCPVGYRELSFYFRVGEPPTPTPTATRTSTAPTATLPVGVTPTVTNTPTRTPTPTPPPPPVAEPDFHLRIHSPYDPQHGVYRSDSAEITWPLAERLNWMPDVDLVLPPDLDPYYDFRTRVIGWSFVSSLGKDTKTSTDSMGRTGCRAREEPTSAELGHFGVSDLQGCVYRYKENPTEADILRQAHTMWTSFLPADMATDVYVYKLPEIKSADLVVEVKILVEVVQTNTGAVVGFATQVERISYTVNFAIPRSAK